ncbi:MAG: hypothetical protein RL131_287 [Bacteroidota bacterium]
MLRTWLSIFLIASAVLAGCGTDSSSETSEESSSSPSLPAPAPIGHAVLNAYPHDTAAFTQGLEVYNDYFFESTGLLGRSSLRKVEIKTGKVVKKIDLPKDVFAEGLTVLNDTLYQLSWQNKLVFMYDAKTLKPLGNLPWSGEGWGITNDGKQLIISEGSDKLYFVQPSTLKINKVLSINDQYGSVNNLNELEMVDGFIYANRWQYDYILKIDPSSGQIVGLLNLSDFLARNSRADLTYLKQKGSVAMESGAVLNGIAYYPKTKSVFITGKLWPEVFELSLK